MEIPKQRECPWLKGLCNESEETSELYCYVCILNEAFRDLVAIKNSLGKAILPVEEAFHVAGDARDFFKVVNAASKFYAEKFQKKQKPDATPIFRKILEQKDVLVSYRV